MSLIKCPECGKVFSDRAAHCPQCGLPTSDALEMITNTPEAGQQPPQAPAPEPKPAAPQEPQTPAPTYYPPYTPMPEQNRERSVEPKKQRNLLTLILIVAVIVLAIVCIALVFTTSGVLNNSADEETDTVATMQTLPPDTTPARVEEQPEAKPVIHTPVPEEIPAESEEIEIEAPSAPAAEPQPAPAPEPAPAPAPTEE